MRLELDHLFVLTSRDAPEAEVLLKFGLREGPPNSHPGQGTANRRFAFFNAMIELLWVSDEMEARSARTRRTMLWERWSGRGDNASPFGICVRPAATERSEIPFASWEYRPEYLSTPLVMQVGEAGFEEPMWIYLDFMRRSQREKWFKEHRAKIREITGLTLTSPVPIRSDASRKIVEDGVLEVRAGMEPLLEVEFDGGHRNTRVDFRAHLPLAFRM